MKPPTGSRGDVQAAGLWANGTWYLEVKRALNTGNADDGQLTVGQAALFGIALMDNAGGELHWAQGSVLNKLGVGITVDVEQVADLVPQQFLLKQNYPNPFNPTTHIEFQVPMQTHVRLGIYNILGQPVRVLVDQELEGGIYKVTWDGRSGAGVNVTSGVYFYRLESPSYTVTNKMVLMR